MASQSSKIVTRSLPGPTSGGLKALPLQALIPSTVLGNTKTMQVQMSCQPQLIDVSASSSRKVPVAARDHIVLPIVLSLAAFIVNAISLGRLVEGTDAHLLDVDPNFRLRNVDQIFPARSADASSRIERALREPGLPE